MLWESAWHHRHDVSIARFLHIYHNLIVLQCLVSCLTFFHTMLVTISLTRNFLFFRRRYPKETVITFLTWMLYNVPAMLACTLCSWLYFQWALASIVQVVVTSIFRRLPSWFSAFKRETRKTQANIPHDSPDCLAKNCYSHIQSRSRIVGVPLASYLRKPWDWVWWESLLFCDMRLLNVTPSLKKKHLLSSAAWCLKNMKNSICSSFPRHECRIDIDPHNANFLKISRRSTRRGR